MSNRLVRPLLVMGLLAFVLGYVWERVDIVRVGYKAEQLKTQKIKLERERDELSVKLAALSAPDRVAKVAREKLGMVQPQQGQIVVVRRAGPSLATPTDEPTEVQVARSLVK